MAKPNRVPPPLPPAITGVTPELLAMRWETENKARSFLIRSRTSLKRLNVGLVAAEEGGFRLMPMEPDVPVVAQPAPELFAVPVGADYTSDFETYATAVDGLLEAAGEQPAPDAQVHAFFDEHLSAEAAVERIVLGRHGTDEPVVEAPAKPAKKAAAKKKAAPVPPAPANDETPQQVLESMERPAPALIDQPATGQVYLRFVQPFDLSDSIRGTAARLARQSGIDIAIVDAATGEVRETFASRKPKLNGTDKPRKQNTLPRILELLARDEGVSGVEIKEELGWDNVPGPWFFRHWTTRAHRDPHKDLIQVGKDPDGSYRYRLPPV